MNSYCWDDHRLARAEILIHVESLQDDPYSVWMAGASRGGRLVIELTLNELLFRGSIAAIPALRDMDEFAQIKEGGSAKKGVIITGGQNPCYPQTKKSKSLLGESVFP